MLFREDPEGAIAISQPAHAWLTGQLARAWGNQQFGNFVPSEEVCLAAEQHDIAHAEWEKAPVLNPRTGRPYSFFEAPKAMHIGIISAASSLVLAQGRYAALLVSLHFTGFYENFEKTSASPEVIQAIEGFLAREHAFQAQMLTSLQNDPYYAPYAAPETVERNRQLIKLWDAMSLVLCFGLKTPRSYPDVPTCDGTTTLTLIADNADPTRVLVDPWPFRTQTLELLCDGRRLPETFTDEEAMRRALAQAPWLTIRWRLQPGAAR
jgi:hypothetical protein